MTRHRRPTLVCSAALLAAVPLATHAQDVSRVVAATIYSDGAVVERQLKTPGATRHIAMGCMPPGFDVSTLQVDGDASLRVGDIRTEPVTGDDALACARGPLDARLRELDDRRSALDAETRADDIALDYLRRWNGSAAEPAAARASGTAGLAADSLRKSALQLMTDQARIKQQAGEIDRQVAALRKSVHRAVHAGNWSALRFDISTAGAATLRVRYHVPDARWHLAYRIALDTASSKVRIDRQAAISQGSGEDWTDVALTLSTDRHEQDGGFDEPQPWMVDLRRDTTLSMGLPAAPLRQADQMQRVEVTGSTLRYPGIAKATRAVSADGAGDVDGVPLDHAPVVGMAADEGAWETLFHASQRVAMPSDNEIHTLALDTLNIPVTLSLEARPQADANAYLLATAPRPAGLWPHGDEQLWRDGALIDRMHDVSPIGSERLTLSFGRDERITIAVERPASMRDTQGLFGSQTRLSWGTVFAVTNRHPTPQTLHVLDASPVSRDADLKVESAFDPAPTEIAWRHQPGVNGWTFALAPGQTQRLRVSQSLTLPKDASVTNLPNVR